TQCARQRGDGAAPRRLDDERARRATACEVGALETLAEPPQRGRVEQRGERLRCPGGAIGAGHREQQRGVLPPEQAREQPPQACVPNARMAITIRLPATAPTRLAAPSTRAVTVARRRSGKRVSRMRCAGSETAWSCSVVPAMAPTPAGRLVRRDSPASPSR